MDARNGRHADAVALYTWNTRVSAAFLEILCHTEVLLRNAVDQQFPATDPQLPLSIIDLDVWLCDPATLTTESREKVNEAIARLQRERKRPTRDRVIASLSFGFWQALFSGVYEELWRQRLWMAFPNGSGKRREVANLVGPILHFRNRVAHHEPIFFLDLARHHASVLDLADLIDEEAATYIAALSRVDQLLAERPSRGSCQGL